MKKDWMISIRSYDSTLSEDCMYYATLILETYPLITSVSEWIFFAAIVVGALVLYSNQELKKTFLDGDSRMQQKTRRFYGGVLGVALFVLAISVIIIYIWDPCSIISSGER